MPNGVIQSFAGYRNGGTDIIHVLHANPAQRQRRIARRIERRHQRVHQRPRTVERIVSGTRSLAAHLDAEVPFVECAQVSPSRYRDELRASTLLDASRVVAMLLVIARRIPLLPHHAGKARMARAGSVVLRPSKAHSRITMTAPKRLVRIAAQQRFAAGSPCHARPSCCCRSHRRFRRACSTRCSDASRQHSPRYARQQARSLAATMRSCVRSATTSARSQRRRAPRGFGRIAEAAEFAQFATVKLDLPVDAGNERAQIASCRPSAAASRRDLVMPTVRWAMSRATGRHQDSAHGRGAAARRSICQADPAPWRGRRRTIGPASWTQMWAHLHGRAGSQRGL